LIIRNKLFIKRDKIWNLVSTKFRKNKIKSRHKSNETWDPSLMKYQTQANEDETKFSDLH